MTTRLIATTTRRPTTYRQTNPPVAVDYPTRWGVVGHWLADPATSLVADSHGANTLTNNNTVTTAAGKISAASAQFTATSSESLSVVDNAELSTGAVDFWAACWLWIDSLPADGSFRVIAGKSAAGNTSHEWDLHIIGTGDALRLTTGGAAFRTVGQPDSVTTGQWYFAMVYHDAVNDLNGISVDGAAFTTATTSGTEPSDTTSALRIGARNGSPDRFMDGRIEALTFGKAPALGIAALADEIRDRLYNAGSGRLYPWA